MHWCTRVDSPDDELISLLSTDALVVVVVLGSGELRASNNSEKEERNWYTVI